MSLNILVVEDNPHKRLRIVEYLNTSHADIKVTEKWSFTSGNQALLHSIFDLVLLDISLPTYDRIGSESGGRFRTLGGREIARKIARSNIPTKIIFVTQYDAFSDKGTSYTFDSLKSELKRECGERFLGMVFFNSTQTTWKEVISKAIESIKT